MKTIAEVKELFEWLDKDVHAESKRLQREDDEYYRDTFKVPFIKAPYRVVRLGLGTELIDVPASHIVTNQPQVYVEATSDNETAMERAKKRGTFLNHLVDYLTHQNPQPFKESVKNPLLRGEGWIHLAYNPDFSEGLWANDIPVTFATPDPLIIYATPDERNGVPDGIFLSYKRHYKVIQNKYERWGNPKNRRGDKGLGLSDWLAYFDKDFIYFEADKQAVTSTDLWKEADWDGRVKNLLGFVPFVHYYSGYGKTSPEGRPEELAVSRIRPVKERILTYTELASSQISQLKLYAHKRYDFQPTSPEITFTQDDVKEYDLNYGTANVVPFGVNIIERGGAAPSADVFNYMQLIRYEITRATPPLMSGVGTGSSGRAEDIETKHALSQYESVVDNASTAWATALSMSLHLVKNKEFNLLPLTLRASVPEKGTNVRRDITLGEEDIDDSRCTVRLKAADPIEDKSQAQIGNMMQAGKVIDWATNLMRYHGYSLDEALDIISKTRADEVVARLIASGVLDGAILEQLGIEIPPPQGMAPPTGGAPYTPGPRGGPPRKGNIKSIEALAKDAEMMVANRPPRASPGLG